MAHTCHAFECTKVVKPEMFMCLSHWRRVPRELQRRIWALYRPGQCDDKNISNGYALTAKAAIVAVAKLDGKTVPENDPCLTLYDACIGTSTQPSLAAQTQLCFRAAKDIVFKEHEELLKDLDDRILKEIG
jgi:hypothetical protein